MLQAGQHTTRQELIIARQPTAAAARSQPASPTAQGCHAGAHAAGGRAIRRRKRRPAHALDPPRRSPARISGGNSASGGRCGASPAAAASVARHCGGYHSDHSDRTVQLSWHAHHAYQGVRRAGASGASVGSGAGLAELRAPWRRRIVARDSCPGLRSGMEPRSSRAERWLLGPGRQAQRPLGQQRQAAVAAQCAQPPRLRAGRRWNTVRRQRAAAAQDGSHGSGGDGQGRAHAFGHASRSLRRAIEGHRQRPKPTLRITCHRAKRRVN